MVDSKVPTLSGEIAAGIRQALGTIPEDLLGIAVGDWISEKRTRNRERLKENTKRILKDRGIVSDQETASPILVLAICEAALDEDRVELQDIWARLLAAAIDPSRANRIRTNFIDIVKHLDPIDAVALAKLQTIASNVSINQGNVLSQQLSAQRDEVVVSLLNLSRLGLVTPLFGSAVENGQVSLSPTARELLRILN